MPSPRQTLLKAVADNLKRIRKADGYNTDGGKAVTLEPAPKLASDDAFITAVWSRQQRSDEPGFARTHRHTTVDVVAKVPAKFTQAQEMLDAIVADVEKAMADRAFTYPNGYLVPQYQSAEPLAAQVASGWVGVVITYTTHIPIQ